MADDKFSFEQARVRLEEIASEARKKDTSLERSLDLLEEGVRLANICTELVDHADLRVATAPESTDETPASDARDAVGQEQEESLADGPGEPPASSPGPDATSVECDADVAGA